VNSDPPDDRLPQLVNELIDDRLDATGREELVKLLSSSSKNRAYYRKQIDFESRIKWLLRDSESTHSEPPAQKTPIPKKRSIIAFCGAIAACFAALVIFTSPPAPPTRSIQDTHTSILSSSSARWNPSSFIEERGTQLKPQVYTLNEGFVHLQVGQGVQVFIEAPCSFEPVNAMLFHIHKGRANVEVNEKGHGFTMRTPAGDFVDFGTQFGLAVGSDESGNDVVMSEVFTGEVKMEPRNRDETAFEMLVEGEARGLLGRKSYVEISKNIDDRPIKLDFSRYSETTAFSLYKHQDQFNLALGKKVTGRGYFHGSNGEIFPFSNITDGRINDTGFPGDWSFWLAPDDQPHSAVTIDLEQITTIDCIQILSTRNRHHGDRGTHEFDILTSLDNSSFEPLGSGRLEKIEKPLSADGPPPNETFVFKPLEARFVKIVPRSFYANTRRFSSAGLNEVRIFGLSLPHEIRQQIIENAHNLPIDSLQLRNLAQGRPVSGKGHDKSTLPFRAVDGLIDDARITGDAYSRWLAPGKTGGEFTIDLEKIHPLGLLQIQNSDNGGQNDRGTKDYRILTSQDGTSFKEIFRGTFPPHSPGPCQMIDIPLNGIEARHIRFIADTHYGAGAGLSELRAFAPSTLINPSGTE